MGRNVVWSSIRRLERRNTGSNPVDPIYKEGDKMEEVKVYTTPMCIHCKLVKEYLDEKGIEYESIDLLKNEDEVKIFTEKTQQMSVPVTMLGDKFVIGFDRKQIDRLLK